MPSILADPLLRALAPVVRLTRAQVSPDVLGLLVALAEAAQTATAHDVSPRRTADDGRATMGPPGWITTQEAADLTGCSRRRVQQLAARGLVRNQRAGRAWLIDPDDLARRMRARRTP